MEGPIIFLLIFLTLLAGEVWYLLNKKLTKLNKKLERMLNLTDYEDMLTEDCKYVTTRPIAGSSSHNKIDPEILRLLGTPSILAFLSAVMGNSEWDEIDNVTHYTKKIIANMDTNADANRIIMNEISDVKRATITKAENIVNDMLYVNDNFKPEFILKIVDEIRKYQLTDRNSE